MLTIYHNPRCGKSRQTLALIEASGQKVEVVKYLETPLDKEQLEAVLKKLNMKALDLVRKGEAVFKENFKGKDLSEEEWIAAMVAHPILMERPIVVKDGEAVLGRPPENVNVLL